MLDQVSDQFFRQSQIFARIKKKSRWGYDLPYKNMYMKFVPYEMKESLSFLFHNKFF